MNGAELARALGVSPSQTTTPGVVRRSAAAHRFTKNNGCSSLSRIEPSGGLPADWRISCLSALRLTAACRLSIKTIDIEAYQYASRVCIQIGDP
jgi:hypothetical protein